MILQTIKRRWKLLLLLFAVMCSACVFAACGEDDPTPQELGYTVQVVYDANGGSFSATGTQPTRTFMYKPGTSIMQPTPGQSLNEPNMSGHHVTEWYPATLDEEGEPLKDGDEFVDSEGESIFSGEPWDFTAKLPEEGLDKLYLVAYWDDNYSFVINVGEAAEAGVENYVDNSYTYPRNVIVPVNLPQWTGHTIRYFETADGNRIYDKQDFSEFYLDEENKTIEVTAVWIEGTWDIVTTAADLADMSMFSNCWLENDIDMQGEEFSFGLYTGEFNGNGHTISNIVVNKGTSVLDVPTEFGMFSFSDGGFMHDVTFENATLNVSIVMGSIDMGTQFTIGLFAADGSDYDLDKFTELCFENCSLNIVITEQNYNRSELIYGDGTSYAGIFGTLAPGQVFTPAEGSQPISVKLTLQ